MSIERVAVTPEAEALLRKLQGIHGPLMFHQSGGCCDGSAPMCFPRARSTTPCGGPAQPHEGPSTAEALAAGAQSL